MPAWRLPRQSPDTFRTFAFEIVTVTTGILIAQSGDAHAPRPGDLEAGRTQTVALLTSLSIHGNLARQLVAEYKKAASR